MAAQAPQTKALLAVRLPIAMVLAAAAAQMVPVLSVE
jgi:hypothetical protein